MIWKANHFTFGLKPLPACHLGMGAAIIFMDWIRLIAALTQPLRMALFLLAFIVHLTLCKLWKLMTQMN